MKLFVSHTYLINFTNIINDSMAVQFVNDTAARNK